MAETKINKNQAGDGIFTSDNLVAGDNISITQVQQPVIDENTLAVWHFDNSFSNAVSGGTVGDFYLDGSSSSSFSSSVSRFEDGYSLHCNNSGNDRSIVYPSSISFGENNFTVDFWIYLTSSMTGSPFWINFKGLGDLRIYYSKFQFLINGNVQAESSDYTTNSWMHFAIERVSNTLNFYLNGNKFGSATTTSSLTDITFQQQSGSNVYIDEFRLSNVARYLGENFTPFNQPYSNESTPAQYQINNTMPAVSVDSKSITTNSSDQIQTVGVIDQNDTAKAIKTWTGTKAQYDAIATKDADTIYTTTDEAGDSTEFADTSLSNITNAGKIVGAGLGMPSNVHTSLSIGASGATYTAPSNGYFYVGWTPTGIGGWVVIYNTRSGMDQNAIIRSAGSGSEWWTRSIAKCFKGDVVNISYSGCSIDFFSFVYAEGSKSEAN